MKKKRFPSVVLLLSLLVCSVVSLQPLTVFAQSDTATGSNADPSAADAENTDPNSINQFNIDTGLPYYIVGNSCADTSTTQTASTDLSNFNPDPQAVKIYQSDMAPKLKSLDPLYQKAAQAEHVADWEILAGVHNVEHGLSRTNVTNSFGFMTPFQMGAAEIRGAGGDPSDPRLADGHTLTDDEFVYVARLALRVMKSKAAASTVNADMSKPLSLDKLARIAIAYNTGQASDWLTGGKDPNLMPYAWAGFDTGKRKLPMTYEQGTISIPGAITTLALIRKNNPGSISGTQCSTDATSVGKLGSLPSDRSTLVNDILAFEKNGKLVFEGGVCNSPTGMEDEIRTLIQITALQGLLAVLEWSGASKVPISCMDVGHGGGGLHPQGLAIDIDYDPPNGPNPDTSGNGNKIQKFVIDNWQALKIYEYFWEVPPLDKCIYIGKPAPCSSLPWGEIGDHTNHMHLGFNKS